MRRLTSLLTAAAALCLCAFCFGLAGCGFTATIIPAAPVPVANPVPTPTPAPPPAAGHDTWTWVNGPDIGNHAGVYGSQGVPAAGNTPGGRAYGASWTDSSGNFWLFGGIAAPSSSADTLFNDLWEYSNGQWTWVNGSNQPNQAGHYGTQGVPAATNVPGARSGTMSWTDSSGNFWLFGGVGLDGNGVSNSLNDLWEFKNSQWTWLSGSDLGTQNQPGQYGVRGVAAPSNVPGARFSAVTWTDTTGKLWLFGGVGIDSAGVLGELNDLWSYSEGEWTWMAGSNLVNQPGSYGTLGAAADTNTPGARYEAAGWTDAQGALWLFGGAIGPNGQVNLVNDLWRYSRGQWTWMGGSNQPNQPGTYGARGVSAAANMPGSRVAPIVWTDASGTVWLFGGNGYDSVEGGAFLNDLWSYSAGQWTWVHGSNLGAQPGLYGTRGSPATGNTPGGRLAGFSWVDVSGKLWLFGGDGYDATAAVSYLNDLWAYQP